MRPHKQPLHSRVFARCLNQSNLRMARILAWRLPRSHPWQPRCVTRNPSSVVLVVPSLARSWCMQRCYDAPGSQLPNIPNLPPSWSCTCSDEALTGQSRPTHSSCRERGYLEYHLVIAARDATGPYERHRGLLLDAILLDHAEHERCVTIELWRACGHARTSSES